MPHPTDTDPDLTRHSAVSPASPSARRADPEPVAEEDEAPKALGLSLTQVVGGALAAMTAAFLGSRFSLGGTVAGAAVASIVAAVGGAVYTSSLRRTRDTVRNRVRSVWTGDTRGVPTVVEPTGRRGAEPTPTRVDGVPTAVPAAVSGVRAAVSPRSPVALTEARPEAPGRPSRTRRIVVRTVVAAVAIFGLAGIALTTVELLTGHALSGGQGTTISNVREESAPDPRPTESAPTAEASPSAEATPETTAEPSTEPSAEPSATPSTDPSATPTPSPTPTPATPTPSAEGLADPTG